MFFLLKGLTQAVLGCIHSCMDDEALTYYREQVMQAEVLDTLPPEVVMLLSLLEIRIDTLEEEVARLKHQAALDSRTSSKPPSTDQSRRARHTRSSRTPSGKCPGGQPGHPGTRLTPRESPDRVIRHAVDTCVQCGGDVSRVAVAAVQTRQVLDLPPIVLEVTEHQVETKICPHCHHATTAAFPPGVESPVQYGDRLKGVLVYLHQYQLIPYQRSCELVEDLFGQSVSEGTLANANMHCHATLAPVERALIRFLQQADVVHFDETSLFQNGERWWLHSASTNEATYYFPHPKRGKAAIDAAGVLPDFTGTAMHDHWASYQTYDDCAHAFCNAHHLRELDRAAEQDEAVWAEKMGDLLRRIKSRVEEAKAQGQTRLSRQEAAMFHEWYCSLLFDAYVQDAPQAEANPPPSRQRRKQSKEKNLRDRLYAYAFETLAFMYDFRVPFDNNLAERDIRMTKVKQKISGGFRSEQGLAQFCRIRGFISTVKKQGGNVLKALSATFQGQDMLTFVRLETPE